MRTHGKAEIIGMQLLCCNEQVTLYIAQWLVPMQDSV